MCSVAFSQQHATPYTECQLSITEILQKQDFDIDEPVSEDARNVFFEMYETLNLIYKSDSNDSELTSHISDFNKAIQKANNMSLNITMFQEDIDNISKITP